MHTVGENTCPEGYHNLDSATCLYWVNVLRAPDKTANDKYKDKLVLSDVSTKPFGCSYQSVSDKTEEDYAGSWNVMAIGDQTATKKW